MKKLYCVGCHKVAATITDGRVAKGLVVRCAKCEQTLKTQLQSLNYLAKMNENKSSNAFSDIFGKNSPFGG